MQKLYVPSTQKVGSKYAIRYTKYAQVRTKDVANTYSYVKTTY